MSEETGSSGKEVAVADVANLRANVAENYCTKQDARDIEGRIDKRIGDMWKVIIGVIVPLVVAIIGLIAYLLSIIIKTGV